MVIETISVPGGSGIRTARLKTNFKKIINVFLTSYITYGQEGGYSQSLHDSNKYVIENKSLRFYCNGNQTVSVCIIGVSN